MGNTLIPHPPVVKVDAQGKVIVRNVLLNGYLTNSGTSKCQGM
jgi:hypothetical protein